MKACFYNSVTECAVSGRVDEGVKILQDNYICIMQTRSDYLTAASEEKLKITVFVSCSPAAGQNIFSLDTGGKFCT